MIKASSIPNPGKGSSSGTFRSREEKKDLPPFAFLDFKDARTKLRTQGDLLSPTLGKGLTPLIEKIAESFLRPNLTFNKDETEERKKSARERANPVYFQVKRGEVIVRAGDRIQEENLFKIKAIRKAQESSYVVSILIGIGLLTFLSCRVSIIFRPRIFERSTSLPKTFSFSPLSSSDCWPFSNSFS